MSTITTSLQESIKLVAGNRIVFLGDSITQSGVRPGGYVSLIEHAIREQFDLGDIEVIGAGISGNQIPDCLERLESDVLSQDPSHVVVFAGVNDVWKTAQGQGTSAEEFETALIGIVDQVTQAGARVFVCTPALIGERVDPPNSMDELLDQYCEIVRRIAGRDEVHLIDLRKECKAYLQNNNTINRPHSVLTTDGVHLNSAGNRFVARCICDVLEIETSQRPSRVLKQLVLFKFNRSADDPVVRNYLDELAKCAQQHELVMDHELGANVSTQQKSNGFTHLLSLTFIDEADRGVFQGNATFVNLMDSSNQILDNTMSFDYWIQRSAD